jgi:hypothetical protein
VRYEISGFVPELTDVIEVVQQGVSATRPQVMLTGILSTLPGFPLHLQALVHTGISSQRRVLVPPAMSVDKQEHFSQTPTLRHVKPKVYHR